MPYDLDALLDRRRLKRRMRIWQGATILAVIGIVLVSLYASGELVHGDRIARIYVEGVIVRDDARAQTLAELASDESVRGVVIHIDSPGGTVVGGEALYHSVRKFAKKKPVVAVMGETATSAAYMVAIATDRIFAHAGSITGSIGVLMQTADVTKLLEKIGVKPESVKSGRLKAQPNPMEPFSDQARTAIRDVVLDLYEMCVGLVKERRQFYDAKAKKLADGRVYTGRQALKNGLLDSLGGEAAARQWLAEKRKIPQKLPVRDVGVAPLSEKWRELLGGIVGKIVFSERLRLDGPISVWHPELR